MLLNTQYPEDWNILTPHIKLSYSDLKLTSKTPLYHIYEGKALSPPYSLHTIRVLDVNSEFAQEDYDAAASLFIKELLHLISIDPTCVLVNSFEISEKKMGFVTLPYAPLSHQLQIA